MSVCPHENNTKLWHCVLFEYFDLILKAEVFRVLRTCPVFCISVACEFYFLSKRMAAQKDWEAFGPVWTHMRTHVSIYILCLTHSLLLTLINVFVDMTYSPTT